MGKAIVNKHIGTYNGSHEDLVSVNGMFDKRTYDEGKKAREGEIIIVNDNDNPGIIISNAKGEPVFISPDGHTSSEISGKIPIEDNSLKYIYHADDGKDYIKVNVSSAKDNSLKLSDEGLYVNVPEISSEQIKDIENRISENTEKINNSNTRITDVENSNSSNTESINIINATVSTLNAKTDRMEIQVETNKTDISDIDTRVSTLESKSEDLGLLEQLSESVNTNANNIKSNAESIGKINDDINGINKSVNQAQAKADDASNKVETISGRVDESDASILKLKEKDTEIESKIETLNLNGEAIQKNTDRIEAIEKSIEGGNIADMDKKIEENATNIAKNSGDIVKVNQKVTEIATLPRISSIKTTSDGNVFGETSITDNSCVISLSAHTVPLKDSTAESNGLAASLDVKAKTDKIDAYTVNGIAISGNPVLKGNSINTGEGYSTISLGNSEIITNNDDINTALKKLENMLWASMESVSASLNDINNKTRIPYNEINADGPVTLEPYALYNISFNTGFDGNITLKRDELMKNANTGELINQKKITPEYMFEFVYNDSIKDMNISYDGTPEITIKYDKELKFISGNKYYIKIMNDIGFITDFGSIL